MNYHSFDHGNTPPIEYLKGKEETYQPGEALSMGADGAVTKCAATARPDYLCLGPVQSDGTVPCSRVEESIIYDAALSAAGTALKLGQKVTLSADGMEVTATTSGGVAELVRMDGTNQGDLVGIRFPRSAGAGG